MKEDAALDVMAHFESSIIFLLEYLSEYQGLWTVSLLETISDKALVVLTPKLCIASDAKNSRTLLLKIALPSSLLQKGVLPAPFNYISHRFPLFTTSPTEITLPSPYPFPVPKGQWLST